jgi:hypothetical protein
MKARPATMLPPSARLAKKKLPDQPTRMVTHFTCVYSWRVSPREW